MSGNEGEEVSTTEMMVAVTSGETAQAAIKAKYKMGRVLGQGAGKVKLATAEDGTMGREDSGKKNLSASDEESLKLEMQILCKVNHENVVMTKRDI